MLINYLKIALRNLIRHKAFSLINILGLAFGIAACVIIYFFVSFEKSYDTFNVNAENIYRLKNIRYYTSGTDSSTGCIALLGPTLKEEIPEVVSFARVRKISTLASANNNCFNEKNIFWADSSFLTMFSFPLISGDVNKALADKYCAVLTEKTALKYYGNVNVLGQTIQIGGTDFKITGVTENVPPNSHIQFDILISFTTQLNDQFCWGCNNNTTYIQISTGTKKTVIEEKLPLITAKLHDRQKDGFERAYLLQPLKDIHLYSNLRFEHEENGNYKTINFFSLTAIIVLLIAWINYINLSTARSIERAKEVGLRKVAGAGFGSLIRQFLLESFIINLIAVILSFFIVEITLPYWSELAGMPITYSLLKNVDFIILLVGLVFISPIIAGIYPAFIISTYLPVSILKGSFKSSLKGIILRKGLVIFQFAISITLIAIVIVFHMQISFMRNKNLGFDIKQKLVMNTPSKLEKGIDRTSVYNSFINELHSQSLIEDATYSSVIPGMENSDVGGGIRPANQAQEQGKQLNYVYVAQNYLKFFNIDLIAGRSFFESDLTELYIRTGNRGLIINESAVKAFGFDSPQKALGVSLVHDDVKIGNVIGVIKDYHQQSLDKEIKPVIYEGVTRSNYFIFEINARHASEKIQRIKDNFENMFPGNPFEYNFLDVFFDRQYKTDIQTAEIIGLFMFLSIFISCLGLIGLSSLMTIHRTKEIGVRKVLGASVHSLLALLSKEFIKWLLISNVVAWPLAYYFMNKWLEDFAYKIEISWWIFALSGGIALVIALATVSFQAVKAATANPVESLRYE
ncbi:MAG TPA: ABC transporter permease [Ignavibacteriaceae bacterium]|nr:ABC transporter permease [Ignavibacteriaceae bacterium]